MYLGFKIILYFSLVIVATALYLIYKKKSILLGALIALLIMPVLICIIDIIAPDNASDVKTDTVTKSMAVNYLIQNGHTRAVANEMVNDSFIFVDVAKLMLEKDNNKKPQLESELAKSISNYNTKLRKINDDVRKFEISLSKQFQYNRIQDLQQQLKQSQDELDILKSKNDANLPKILTDPDAFQQSNDAYNEALHDHNNLQMRYSALLSKYNEADDDDLE